MEVSTETMKLLLQAKLSTEPTLRKADACKAD